jgi:isoleucyl-tRNA synthetase
LPREQQMPESIVGKALLEKHGKSDANEAVLHELRLRHALLHQENYHHSYPHCWRSKTPIVFRAMDQWFIEIDHSVPNNGIFREEALAEIGRVNWIPDWGVNRIKGAVQSRPDWCISRQRTWGVPIPAFYDANGEAILDAQIVRNVADLIEKHDSNVWFEKSAAELWPLVKPKNWSGAEAVAKSNDTLDVWIDSGSSSRAVIARRKEISGKDKPFQADMYLEGSDQHRGWFQSSLLLSLAGNGAAPYKTVLTHGFMVDADREKISKSKQGQGGYEKPQTAEAYVKKWGADVVRLWVASQDFRNDVVVSEERVNKVGETYRAIRNALRYQLSNLYDFEPAKHSVADDKLTGLDRWILGEFSKLEKEVIEAYDKYEFHVVYQKVSQFIAVELSAIYHDVIKDRLYTDPANSLRRRSTQTALLRLMTGLCQMLAPILSFTADEAWEFVPRKKDSVHEGKWKLQFFSANLDVEKWNSLLALREHILPELEKARQNKQIGKSLEAKVVVKGRGENAHFWKGEEETLRELLNVSSFVSETESIDPMDVSTDEIDIRIRAPRKYYFRELILEVSKADGQKCERCWRWDLDVGQTPEHPTICGRCVEAVKQFQLENSKAK